RREADYITGIDLETRSSDVLRRLDLPGNELPAADILIMIVVFCVTAKECIPGISVVAAITTSCLVDARRIPGRVVVVRSVGTDVDQPPRIMISRRGIRVGGIADRIVLQQPRLIEKAVGNVGDNVRNVTHEVGCKLASKNPLSDE